MGIAMLVRQHLEIEIVRRVSLVWIMLHQVFCKKAVINSPVSQ